MTHEDCFPYSRRGLGLLLLAALGLGLTAGCRGPATGEPDLPTRVLLTNDNGIDDTGLVELARAFAEVPGMEVHVVAAMGDRSGTSNYLGATKEGRYRVERRDLGPNIQAWALDGFPADCVIFALTGPLRDRPPDIVVSGINGGPNLADAWFGSGTIGAARTAAYFGVPAVAVSGVEDDHPGAVQAATDWVVRFVRSDAVASLEAPEYLTVSIPVGTPPEIRGARIVHRARGVIQGRASRIEVGPAPDPRQTWRLDIQNDPEGADEGTDISAVGDGYIAIVPMRVDEFDGRLADRLRDRAAAIPEWIPPEASEIGSPAACEIPLGVTVDDAEDEAGREWGVVLEEVEVGSVAERTGLTAGDVIVSLNGTDLASEPGDPEDPDDRFARLFRPLECGDAVELEYVRDERRRTVRFARDTM
ncbi:MAG: PDZ domain-containing protein [Gemmatimonadetes bacterium]|nr:PDZ domain-containing protein [Gemmatimonadota bacterium]NIR79247.1 PDZ domain-containing protein [Gemmatimonadota bacterium]NIT86289.1 PDZ domain-containing protein [Gemmatimonadota bacterium]NIU31767.1 PDZ domain-containing protein [Gemmatimonadota bacterium]NIU35066.1 PDZ domain-containing protein [Gemmatimonadota bacterium]